MRLAEWLDSTEDVPRREREILLEELAGVTRAQSLIEAALPLDCARVRALGDAIVRLRRGEPLAYVLGHQDFWNLRLQVSPSVLIPRPETELLVELALARAGPQARLLDLGTGSGAIALACASARGDLSITAADRSSEALALASANADHLDLTVTCLQSDWFELIETTFDLIVSNPPYVARQDPHLEALAFEPQQALVAGADGLDDIRRIVAEAPQHLNEGGWLALEHGFDQADRVRALMSAAGFVAIATEQDLAGHERVTHGRLNEVA